jgi:hypothetical protein
MIPKMPVFIFLQVTCLFYHIVFIFNSCSPFCAVIRLTIIRKSMQQEITVKKLMEAES